MRMKKLYIFLIISTLTIANNLNIEKLLKLSKNGDISATYSLGTMYYEGNGTLMNPPKGVEFLKIAGKKENSKAQIYLAKLYCTGDILKQDLVQCAYWAKKADENKVKEASILWKKFKLWKHYNNHTSEELAVTQAKEKTPKYINTNKSRVYSYTYNENGIEITTRFPKKVTNNYLEFSIEVTNKTSKNKSGGLTISFPQYKQFDGEIISNNFSSINTFNITKKMYHRIHKKNVPVLYLAIEGWNNKWGTNETKKISLKMKVSSDFTYIDTNIRAILIDKKKRKNLYPEKSFLLDQQGYPVAQIRTAIEQNNQQEKNIGIVSDTDEADRLDDTCQEIKSKEYENLCLNGDKDACFVLGVTYALGSDCPIDVNPYKGKIFLQKACELKHLDSCNKLGYIYENSIAGVREPSYTKAMHWYAKSCKLGDKVACRKSQQLNKKKLSKKKKENKDAYSKVIGSNAHWQKIKKSCLENNNANACFKLGEKFFKEDLYTLKLLGIKLYNKSCSLNNPYACFFLGDGYDKYSNTIHRLYSFKKDALKATKFYIKSKKILTKKCLKKDGKACALLGDIYEKGLGVRVNKKQSLKYRKQACKFGNSKACITAAVKNLGTSDDTMKERRELLTISCNLKNANGCEILASDYKPNHYYHTGNKKLYFKFMKDACFYGEPTVCLEMGAIYEKGDSYFKIRKNKKAALRFYKKGCSIGNEISCSNYEILKSE